MLKIHGIGVEVGSNPFFELSMELVRRVSDRLPEFEVAPGPADIFGRAAPYSFDKTRVIGAGYRINDPFDRYGVVPTVAEIIEVSKFIGIAEELAEGTPHARRAGSRSHPHRRCPIRDCRLGSHKDGYCSSTL